MDLPAHDFFIDLVVEQSGDPDRRPQAAFQLTVDRASFLIAAKPVVITRKVRLVAEPENPIKGQAGELHMRVADTFSSTFAALGMWWTTYERQR